MLKNIDEYWLSVRCHAKRVYPPKILILHIHIDLMLEYFFLAILASDWNNFLKYGLRLEIFFGILA